MIYKEFRGMRLSALGMGGMRFPVKENGEIDEARLYEMVDFAIAEGVNYFDTAWGYHGGASETLLGAALKRHPRKDYYLATKFPGYDPENMGKVKEIFPEQLKKCGVEYFDFYLFHNVTEGNIDGYLDPKNGIMDYLLEEKRRGRIRHLGFSAHGTLDTVKRFLASYGEHMEFCQIQLNWLDYKMQNAKAKVEFLRERGLPIWVMEPVRGGKLAFLEEKYERELRALRPEAGAVEWAFRFLQSFPEVKVILSGMSDMAQLRENVGIFREEKPLDEREMASLLQLGDKMTGGKILPCTACRYCVDYCAMGLDIPRIVKLYNEQLYFGGGFHVTAAIGNLPDDKKPSACIACGACETVCPQKIRIPAMMKDFTERLKRKK